jgi:uncharacterized cupin superfamily protein
MAERRHAAVIHLSEAPTRTVEKGKRFGFTGRILGQAAGGAGLGCSWYEVPPGRTAFPAHYHCATEEAIFVLEGEGTLRIGAEKVPVHAGDYVALVPGPDHAHQLVNTGAAPLRYLCMSTLVRADVVGYPDSKKVGAMGVAPAWKFGTPPLVRIICREDTALDYYDGEAID